MKTTNLTLIRITAYNLPHTEGIAMAKPTTSCDIRAFANINCNILVVCAKKTTCGVYSHTHCHTTGIRLVHSDDIKTSIVHRYVYKGNRA